MVGVIAMPVTPTYPGVYIEEVPSGVRTITGVATSVTAFVGKAMRGPVNKAERVLSLGDFARKFGGISASSEMSYAVQQFFLNGGTEAWIVRIAKDAVAAQVKDGVKIQVGGNAETLFEVTAKYEGKVGNSIKMDIDYKTRNPGSTFNLIVQYVPAGNPADASTERFVDLSMGKEDPRNAVKIVNRGSELIELKEVLLSPAKVKPLFGKQRQSCM
jgi:phage tail sheath protein FI